MKYTNKTILLLLPLSGNMGWIGREALRCIKHELKCSEVTRGEYSFFTLDTKSRAKRFCKLVKKGLKYGHRIFIGGFCKEELEIWHRINNCDDVLLFSPLSIPERNRICSVINLFPSLNTMIGSIVMWMEGMGFRDKKVGVITDENDPIPILVSEGINVSNILSPSLLKPEDFDKIEEVWLVFTKTSLSEILEKHARSRAPPLLFTEMGYSEIICSHPFRVYSHVYIPTSIERCSHLWEFQRHVHTFSPVGLVLASLVRVLAGYRGGHFPKRILEHLYCSHSAGGTLEFYCNMRCNGFYVVLKALHLEPDAGLEHMKHAKRKIILHEIAVYELFLVRCSGIQNINLIYISHHEEREEHEKRYRFSGKGGKVLIINLFGLQYEEFYPSLLHLLDPHPCTLFVTIEEIRAVISGGEVVLSNGSRVSADEVIL